MKKEMQSVKWFGWDVSHTEQRLIADSTDKLNPVPARKMTEGQRLYSPHIMHSPLPPTFSEDCRIPRIKFPAFPIFRVST